MRPRPITLIVCLFLGVVISILVAWRCAIVGERASTSQTIPQDRVKAFWREVVGPIAEKNTLDGRSISAAGNTWSMFGEEPEMMSDGSLRLNQILVVLRRQTGMPFRCVEGDDIVRIAAPPQYETHELHGYLKTPGISLLTDRKQYGLPIRPLWLGLILNILFYSALTFGMLSCIAYIRRRSRLDRKHCPKCGHDLRATLASDHTKICPECGEHVADTALSRPRMIPRWWMTPFFLPIATLLTIWFLGGFDWLWLRYQLRWGESIFTIPTIVLVALAMIFFYSIGINAYRDRPARARRVISICAAVALALIAYVPLHVLTLWFASK